MNTRGHLLRGAALSGGSVLLSMAALLAVGKIATNALSPAEVAAFALILLVADALNLLGSLGLPVALPKLLAAAAPAAEARVTAVSSLKTTGIVCLLLAAPVLVFALLPAPALLHEDSPWRTAWPHLIWIAPFLIAGAMRDTAMAALAGLNRYGPRALGIVVSAAAQVLLAMLAVLAYRGGLPGLLAATGLAYALAAAWLLWSLRDAFSERASRPAARAAVRFSRPLYANSLLNFIFQRVDTLLLALLLGDPAPVAIYEMAKRLPMVLSRGLGALLVPFLPAMAARFAAGDKPAATRLLDRSLAITAFIGFSTTFGAILLQEALLLTLFSPAYLAATRVLGILLGVMTLAVLTGLHGQTLIAMSKPGWVTGINVGTAALSVLLNLLFIPVWGLTGAALAAAGAAAFSYAAQALAVRQLGVHVTNRSAILPLLFALIAGLFIAWLDANLEARAMACFFFVAACFLAGVVRPGELRDLWHATQSR